jgi:hypothetical protein
MGTTVVEKAGDAAVTNLQPFIPAPVWDASAGTFPLGDLAGYTHKVSVGGTVGGVVFTTNDALVAEKNAPSTTIFAGNWQKWVISGQVLSVNTRTGAVVLNSSDVTLGNCDNTSDANKPVSTATQTALNLKANLASPTFTGTVTIPSAVISGLRLSTSTKTTTYSIVSTDYTLRADATVGAFTITLPTAVGIDGQVFVIKKIDATGNSVTIATTSSQTIDGNLTAIINSRYLSITVQSNGTNWDII